MPNKTIYVSDGDLALYQRAQELAGGNLSSAIASALRRYVDVEQGRSEGFDEIVVRVGSGKQMRKVRFSGVLVGEWVNSSSSRGEIFRVYRSRTGKFVVHIDRTPEWRMVDADGKPAGWRGALGLDWNVSYGTSARRSRRSSTTWSPARSSIRLSRTSTSSPGDRLGHRHAFTAVTWAFQSLRDGPRAGGLRWARMDALTCARLERLGADLFDVTAE